MNDRDCENCAHHTGGSCSVCECSYEPIEDDLISRQAAVDAVNDLTKWYCETYHETRPTTIAVIDTLNQLPSAQPDIAEKLYQYKCYITDKDDLQHEVIYTGDIRRVTGWEI